MATKYTKEQLLNKKIFDYTFIVAFFLILSFFIFFAIKPNLETAFKLQKELGELKQIDTNYNQAIDTIIRIQSAIEQNRDRLPLLEEALPDKPLVNTVVADIQRSASDSGLPIKSLNVIEVPVTNNTKDKLMKQFIVKFDTDTDFNAAHAFVASFLTQRRLKLINELTLIDNPRVSSGSARLSVSFQVESYYL